MVKKDNYIPHRGDLVWLNFKPQTGHEQSGRRPAIVLSNYDYNRIVGLAIFCTVTSKTKGYPFEIQLPEGLQIRGSILTDQIKSLDWQQREIEFIQKLDDITLSKVINMLKKIIEV